MKNLIATLVSLVVLVSTSLIAPVAKADDMSITVRITDQAAVEHELGACGTGYYVVGLVDGRQHSYRFGSDRSVTISTRSSVHSAPYLEFACETRDLGMPTSGVEISISSN